MKLLQEYINANNEIYKLYNTLKTKINEAETTDVEITSKNQCFIQDIKGSWTEIPSPLKPYEIEMLGNLLATNNKKIFNNQHPCLDTQIIYDGARINITIPPLSQAPTLSLRFHHIYFHNIKSLIENKMLSLSQAETLIMAVKDKKNIIISGETNSGKSTLLNALCNEIPKDERIIIIEDTRELEVENLKQVEYLTTGSYASSSFCVETCLRKNPDRIIYGEVRGEEALSLIEAWNTAHRGGLCTIHANNANAVLTRLISLCGHKSVMDQTNQIKEAIDVIVQIEIKNGQRSISEIKFKN